MLEIKPNVAQCFKCNYFDETGTGCNESRVCYCLAKLTLCSDNFGYEFSRPEIIDVRLKDIDKCPCFLKRG